MKKLLIAFSALAVMAVAGTIAISYDLAVNIFDKRQAVTREYVIKGKEEETDLFKVVSYVPEKAVKFYIRSQYGKVTVYNENGTVHDYTDIRLSRLPRNLQIAVLNTYVIEGESGLYDFLETYSS